MDVYSAVIDIENGDWYYDSYWKGLHPTDNSDGISEKIGLKVTVAKYDIACGAYRNYKLQYKVKDINHVWSNWMDTEEFTVSVEDITISGTAGTLCNTGRDYSISAPTGYSSSWSFSPSTFVTASSGSNTTTATLTGSCNYIGDGVLTFTMMKASCPTLTTTRTINVNGPNPTDLELDVRYTNGTPVPKYGSVYQLCPYTHYHITLVNNAGCSTSNLSWTLPAGWTKNYQYSTMVSIYTNSSPGGQMIVKGQTCCSGCGTNMTLLTGYFGYYYSCGGYFMASPNPGSNYIDIDIATEAVDLKEYSYDQEIELRVFDKMGIVVLAETVRSLPYRIDTSNLPEGNYVVYMVTEKKNGKDKEKIVKSFQVIVDH